MVAEHAAAGDYHDQSRHAAHRSLRFLFTLVTQEVQLNAGWRSGAVYLLRLRLRSAHCNRDLLPRTQLGFLLVYSAMAGTLEEKWFKTFKQFKSFKSFAPILTFPRGGGRKRILRPRFGGD